MIRSPRAKPAEKSASPRGTTAIGLPGVLYREDTSSTHRQVFRLRVPLPLAFPPGPLQAWQWHSSESAAPSPSSVWRRIAWAMRANTRWMGRSCPLRRRVRGGIPSFRSLRHEPKRTYPGDGHLTSLFTRTASANSRRGSRTCMSKDECSIAGSRSQTPAALNGHARFAHVRLARVGHAAPEWAAIDGSATQWRRTSAPATWPPKPAAKTACAPCRLHGCAPGSTPANGAWSQGMGGRRPA